jgi:hypothetical protein
MMPVLVVTFEAIEAQGVETLLEQLIGMFRSVLIRGMRLPQKGKVA